MMLSVSETSDNMMQAVEILKSYRRSFWHWAVEWRGVLVDGGVHAGRLSHCQVHAEYFPSYHLKTTQLVLTHPCKTAFSVTALFCHQ